MIPLVLQVTCFILAFLSISNAETLDCAIYKYKNTKCIADIH